LAQIRAVVWRLLLFCTLQHCMCLFFIYLQYFLTAPLLLSAFDLFYFKKWRYTYMGVLLNTAKNTREQIC